MRGQSALPVMCTERTGEEHALGAREVGTALFGHAQEGAQGGAGHRDGVRAAEAVQDHGTQCDHHGGEDARGVAERLGGDEGDPVAGRGQLVEQSVRLCLRQLKVQQSTVRWRAGEADGTVGTHDGGAHTQQRAEHLVDRGSGRVAHRMRVLPLGPRHRSEHGAGGEERADARDAQEPAHQLQSLCHGALVRHPRRDHPVHEQ
mmetsp:Transcript_40440/g.101780  ORF Transcript_40440/g.101780 Transcript_40440/m.101780 type:complete len:203 (+) Transcript_40440:489-1097(+)